MYRDEVIEEVWRIRDEYVRQHHGDMDEIIQDLIRRQAEHPERLVIRRSKKPPRQEDTPPS
jgi:hypothetical protein